MSVRHYVPLIIHKETVYLFECDDEGLVIRSIATHSRLRAIDLYENWLNGRDPEALEEGIDVLRREDLPWRSKTPDFPIPAALLVEFAQLMFTGSQRCNDDDHDETSSGDILDELLGARRFLYCYSSCPEIETIAAVVLVVFTDAEGEPVAVIVQDRGAIDEVLAELAHYDPGLKENVKGRLEELPHTRAPSYWLEPTTAEVLMVGHLTRAQTIHDQTPGTDSAN